jgi:hypothetical protein
MRTILSIPLCAFNTTVTMDQATNIELLVALSNILTWLIIALCIFIQALEIRRLDALRVKRLQVKKRQDEYEALNREEDEVFELLRQAREQLAQIPEDAEAEAEVENNVEQGETGPFKILPERSPIQEQGGWNVEDDLKEAMEDEIAEQEDSDESDRSDNNDEGYDSEIVHVPAGRPGGEHEEFWRF